MEDAGASVSGSVEQGGGDATRRGPGGLGRLDEARAATAEALKRYPGLTIEGHVNLPEWTDKERQRLIETLRAANFPACARAEELAHLAKPVRLPECIK